MNKLRTLLFGLVLLGTIAGCDDDDNVDPLDTPAFADLNAAMRELWVDHVVWTRNVIINIMDDTPGTDEAVNRLLQNQDEIGAAMVPYYGASAGTQLTDLLRDHIGIAADLLIAAKAGNTTDFNTANTAWYANADEIATFLNTANPDNWGLAAMKAHMKEHLDLTLAEAVARQNGDYATDVATFDLVVNQILGLADELSEGIALQFPDKF